MTVYTRRDPWWLWLICAPWYLGFGSLILLGAIAGMSFRLLGWAGRMAWRPVERMVQEHREGSG